jgi:hypothetical protein
MTTGCPNAAHARREFAGDDVSAARRERQDDMNRPRREVFDRFGTERSSRDQ